MAIGEGRIEVPESEDEPMTSSPVYLPRNAVCTQYEGPDVNSSHTLCATGFANAVSDRAESLGVDRDTRPIGSDASRHDLANIPANRTLNGQTETVAASSNYANRQAQDAPTNPDMSIATLPVQYDEGGIQIMQFEHSLQGHQTGHTDNTNVGQKNSDTSSDEHITDQSVKSATEKQHEKAVFQAALDQAEELLVSETAPKETTRRTVVEEDNMEGFQSTGQQLARDGDDSHMQATHETKSHVQSLDHDLMMVPEPSSLNSMEQMMPADHDAFFTQARPALRQTDTDLSPIHAGFKDGEQDSAEPVNSSYIAKSQHDRAPQNMLPLGHGPLATSKKASSGSTEVDGDLDYPDSHVTKSQLPILPAGSAEHPKLSQDTGSCTLGPGVDQKNAPFSSLAGNPIQLTGLEATQEPGSRLSTPMSERASQANIQTSSVPVEVNSQPSTSSFESSAPTSTPPPAKTPQEITLAELRLQKTALLASLRTLPAIQVLIEDTESADADMSSGDDLPTDADVMAAANKIVKDHIKLLHDYNELKDVGQGLMGLIADQRGVRIVEVQDEFGIDAKD